MQTITETDRAPYVSEVASEFLTGATILGLVGVALIGLNRSTDPSFLDNSLWITIETAMRDLVELPYNLFRLGLDILRTGIADMGINQTLLDVVMAGRIEVAEKGLTKIFDNGLPVWKTLSTYLNHGKTFKGIWDEPLKTSFPALVGGITHGFLGLTGSIITLGNQRSQQVTKTER